MNNEDLDNMLSGMAKPEPENIMNHRELKIPLLSYKRSSRAGLWLLILPLIVVIMYFLKSQLGIVSPVLDSIRNFFSAIDSNKFLTYLIPLIFIGLPLFAMVINFLAICHFQRNKKMQELIITIKLRPWNIVIFLIFILVIEAAVNFTCTDLHNYTMWHTSYLF